MERLKEPGNRTHTHLQTHAHVHTFRALASISVASQFLHLNQIIGFSQLHLHIFKYILNHIAWLIWEFSTSNYQTLSYYNHFICLFKIRPSNMLCVYIYWKILCVHDMLIDIHFKKWNKISNHFETWLYIKQYFFF